MVDFETTGLAPGRLIEVGAVRMRADGSVVRELSSLADPGPDVELGATWIHHITRERLEGAPPTSEVVGALLAFCQDSVVVAHNLPFEERFLAHELSRLGLDVPRLPGLCTLQAARTHLTMPNYRLGTLVSELELPGMASHAALDDARACGRLLAHLLKNSRGLTVSPEYPALPFVPGPRRFKPRASGLRKGERGWMACLMERLPISTAGAADPAMAAAYVELLTAALADGKITGVEARALADQASRAGMSRAEVEEVHRATLQGMHRVAASDGVITPAEARDLYRAAQALGLPDHFGDLPITSSGDLRPVPR
ncbi:exonuclease domain-containing protein [Actinomadura sp. DC4]|uniref:3'-5' exonuclease n=1 Tax=Actinomadura sp. DC4 TaxID=3055069 RepID=UPI0025AF4343|nr:exonuclease domain-containing protein [Actinomadura sp. DC4]MDN3358771.1 exonuclease domain-containing protein [Actinomadura sp. DC4]